MTYYVLYILVHNSLMNAFISSGVVCSLKNYFLGILYTFPNVKIILFLFMGIRNDNTFLHFHVIINRRERESINRNEQTVV